MSNQNGRKRGPDFPCATLDEALVQLRRPPKPAGVRFKLQNTYEDRGQVAAYIDARLVYDRLDRVCGSRWFPRFEELPERLIPPPVDRDGQRLPVPPLFVRCRLCCFGVVRQDVGEGQDPKAAFSDSIKRAAVQFGVGRVLYAMKASWLREGDGDGELRRNSRQRLIIDTRTEGWLREQYECWLVNHGQRLFGEALGHGDDPAEAALPADRVSGTAPRPAADSQGDGADPDCAPACPDGSAPEPVSAPEVGPSVSSVELERKRVEHWARTGHYKDETVAALAEILCGKPEVAKVDRDGARRLAMALEFAVRAKLADSALAARVAELAKREQRDQAATELSEWLVVRANEAELTPKPRRKAA